MNKNQSKLLFIFTLFAGPLVIAFVAYYGFSAKFIESGTTNNATLIDPVVLTEFANQTVDDKPVILDTLRQKWTIIHLIEDHCQEECEKALYNSRQTRIALGKEAHRVQRMILSTNYSVLQSLVDSQPDAIRVLVNQNGERFGVESQLNPILENEVAHYGDALLIDPLGNVMMLIPLELNPKLLLKDLKRLLKVSRIG